MRDPRTPPSMATEEHRRADAPFRAGSPNIVVIVLDDLGFAHLGCYGFLNGETNQWTPNLIRDTNHIEPPRTPDEGYHLDADLADNAIAYLDELRASHPERPFLLWYATAAPHAPHQAPPAWIERFRG